MKVMLFFIFLGAIIVQPSSSQGIPPLLFLNGFIANGLYIVVNSESPIAPGCPTNWSGNFFAGSCHLLSPELQACIPLWLQMFYDPLRDIYSPPQGVTVRIPFAISSPITDVVAPDVLNFELYKSLATEGYIWGENFLQMAYDYRLAPQLMSPAIETQFQQIVEYLFQKNNNQPVVILGISLGTNIAHYSLRKLPQAWKDQHIRSFILVSQCCVVGQAFAPVFAVTGFNLCTTQIDPTAGATQKGWTVMLPLMPNPIVYQTSIIVQTPTFNLTANDALEIFRLSNRTEMLELYPKIYDPYFYTIGPGVKSYCLISTGNETAFGAIFDNDQLEGFPTNFIMSDGDSDEDLPGLLACPQLWSKTQTQPVIAPELHQFDTFSYLGIGPKSKQVLAYLLNLIITS